jgi:signal transduction histidine kinase
MRVRLIDPVLHALKYGDRPIFQSTVELEHRWGTTKAWANTCVLGFVLWPLALVHTELILALIPVAVGGWYALRRATFSRGMLNQRTFRGAVYSIEIGLFTGLLLYLAVVFKVARTELFLLYVWPLNAMAAAYGNRLGRVLIGFALVTLGAIVMSWMALGVSVASTADAIVFSIWLALLLLALRYADLRSALARRWEHRVSTRWHGSQTYGDVLNRLAQLAAEQTMADIVIVHPVGVTEADQHPFTLLRRGVALRDGNYGTTAVGSATPISRVQKEYLGPSWLTQRKEGVRTLVRLRPHQDEHDPILGGLLNARGEPSFAVREGIKSTAVLVLATRDRPKDIKGVMFLNYRSERGFPPDEREHFDRLAQILASELAIALKQIADEAERNAARARLKQALHQEVRGSLTHAVLELNEIGQNGDGDFEHAQHAKEFIAKASDVARRLYGGEKESAPDPTGDVAAWVASVTGLHRDQAKVRFENWAWPEPFGDIDRAYEIYLIVREAVQNAMNHASATDVLVTVSVGVDGLASDVSVLDDGVGIPASPSWGGAGLEAMQLGAERIGAHFSWELIQPHGRRVLLRLGQPESGL